MAQGDYYPEAQTDTTGEDSDPKSKTDESSEYETFLVPKAAFGKDVNPGESHTVEIVHCYEDEVECRCGGKEEEDDETPSAMDGAMGKLDSMTEKEG